MTLSPPDLDELDFPHTSLRITFPSVPTGVDQDEEWFEVEDGGATRRIRMHDYAAIYETPGLYETLIYRALRCRSPERVIRPLVEALTEAGQKAGDLRVLDLGAGNGIVGELLQAAGCSAVLGVDILPEAARAARRDRPHVYDDYVVTDLTDPGDSELERLRTFAPNCLTTVAALGFGDIPAEAFVRAFNLVPPRGWLAMCIKDRFLEEDDESGFGTLLRNMIADGTVEVLHRERYVHRYSITGEELHYEALVARKVRHARLPG